MTDIQTNLQTRFRGAVFDLDGTLVDSEPAWEKAKHIVAERHGREISAAQIAASIGRSMDDLVADVFAPVDMATSRAIEDEIFGVGEEWLPRLRQPIPGAAAFLRDLHAHGLRIAICSSSREHLIRDALVQLDVLELVEQIVSADPLPRRKPDPMPYQVTAEQLKLPPSELIAFEDALPGARSASGAGLFTVAIGPDTASEAFAFCDMQAPDYPTLRRTLNI
ncbi:MAG: HAD family hydrolase [Paracoccus sp. (in: a-proteobacteria)]